MRLKFSTLLFLLAGCVGTAAEQESAPGPIWAPYDQSGDIATLAQHENERMHFQVLQSRYLDKNELFSPFVEDLAAFGEDRYQALKPLVLDQPITALQSAVTSGDLSYEELTTFYLYRIREIEFDSQRYLNGVISLNPDAIRRARELDRQRQQVQVDADSIFGMPVLLKDNVGFAGLPTTAGAVALANNVTANAFIADRLEENGAVILGKANMSEWAYFFCGNCPSGWTALGGQTLNPYGRFQFGTGGSSSGSGATMAANYAAAAVGSETSGSILSPSSSNSLVGLKPTTGSLSRSGVVPISATLDTAGPMTRSLQDTVIMFNAMAGYDAADSMMRAEDDDKRLQYRQVSLDGKRLGVMERYSDNEYYTGAAELLGANGAGMVPVTLEQTQFNGFGEFLGIEMVRDLATYLDQYGSQFLSVKSVHDVQAFNLVNFTRRAPYGQAEFDMMAGLDLTPAQHETLRYRLQNAARAELNRVFSEGELDVLLSINNFSAGIAALANYPALTIPMGYEEDGRPIGLTLIAPSWEEQRLIDIGARFERLSQARISPKGYQ